mgnify:CR=1 FL=1
MLQKEKDSDFDKEKVNHRHYWLETKLYMCQKKCAKISIKKNMKLITMKSSVLDLDVITIFVWKDMMTMNNWLVNGQGVIIIAWPFFSIGFHDNKFDTKKNSAFFHLDNWKQNFFRKIQCFKLNHPIWYQAIKKERNFPHHHFSIESKMEHKIQSNIIIFFLLSFSWSNNLIV